MYSTNLLAAACNYAECVANLDAAQSSLEEILIEIESTAKLVEDAFDSLQLSMEEAVAAKAEIEAETDDNILEDANAK